MQRRVRVKGIKLTRYVPWSRIPIAHNMGSTVFKKVQTYATGTVIQLGDKVYEVGKYANLIRVGKV